MMDLLSDDLRRDPYPMYRQLRATSPVLQVRPGVWMLLDYDSVKRAMTDHEAFSSRAVPPTGPPPDWLVFSDPPRHAKLRGLILKAFTPRSIAALEPRVRWLSRTLLEPVVAGGRMDLVADYAGPLPTLVIAEMLGLPAADRPMLMRWSEAIMGLSYSVAGGAEAAQAIATHAAAVGEIGPYLSALCDERRRSPKDDLATRLVQAELDGERLGVDDLGGFFQLLLAAGTETTTNLISNTILSLLEHPSELARLRAEPALLLSAIEEVLRFRSPGQMMFRQTRRPVELAGRTLPADELVLVMVGAANRDPKAFADPERFDIARDPNPHIAFGHGIHFCIGAALSRLEGRVAVEDLLGMLPGLALASADPWPPRRALVAHGPQRLPVRWGAA